MIKFNTRRRLLLDMKITTSYLRYNVRRIPVDPQEAMNRSYFVSLNLLQLMNVLLKLNNH